MAEYLIQSETLDDIADAINAKTGGSSAMTPAEMAEEIGNIQTGGSGGGGAAFVLLADSTSSEDANVMTVDIPAQYQNLNVYKIAYVGTFSTKSNAKIYVNSVSSWGDKVNASNFTAYVSRNVPYLLSSQAADVIAIAQQSTARTVAYPITSFGVGGYTEAQLVNAGFNIKVWGLIES